MGEPRVSSHLFAGKRASCSSRSRTTYGCVGALGLWIRALLEPNYVVELDTAALTLELDTRYGMEELSKAVDTTRLFQY